MDASKRYQRAIVQFLAEENVSDIEFYHRMQNVWHKGNVTQMYYHVCLTKSKFIVSSATITAKMTYTIGIQICVTYTNFQTSLYIRRYFTSTHFCRYKKIHDRALTPLKSIKVANDAF